MDEDVIVTKTSFVCTMDKQDADEKITKTYFSITITLGKKNRLSIQRRRFELDTNGLFSSKNVCAH